MVGVAWKQSGFEFYRKVLELYEEGSFRKTFLKH